jgi:hypothetical protein
MLKLSEGAVYEYEGGVCHKGSGGGGFVVEMSTSP